MKVLNFLFVVVVTILLVGTLLFSEENTWKGPGIEGVAWRNGNVGIGTANPQFKFVTSTDAADWTAKILNTNNAAYGLSIENIKSTAGYGLAVYTGSGTGFFVRNNGNVGIGVSTPKKKLHVGGSALIEHLTLGESLTRLYPIRLEVFGGINARGPVYASCGMLTCSDVRYKKDLKPIENALDRVIQLRGVSFNWKDESMGKGQQLGVIGQEVEKVFPEVVSTDSDGYKSVAYSQLVAPLIEAIKELKAENETLKVRIETLEKKLKDY